MNLACLSTSAAASRPCRTSFSVEPLILAMIPPLMLRLPIIPGSSFVDNGLPELAGAFGGVLLWLAWVAVLPAVCSLLFVVCARAAKELANREVAKTRAVVAREKLFMGKTSQYPKEWSNRKRPNEVPFHDRRVLATTLRKKSKPKKSQRQGFSDALFV